MNCDSSLDSASNYCDDIVVNNMARLNTECHNVTDDAVASVNGCGDSEVRGLTNESVLKTENMRNSENGIEINSISLKGIEINNGGDDGDEILMKMKPFESPEIKSYPDLSEIQSQPKMPRDLAFEDSTWDCNDANEKSEPNLSVGKLSPEVPSESDFEESTNEDLAVGVRNYKNEDSSSSSLSIDPTPITFSIGRGIKFWGRSNKSKRGRPKTVVPSNKTISPEILSPELHELSTVARSLVCPLPQDSPFLSENKDKPNVNYDEHFTTSADGSSFICNHCGIGNWRRAGIRQHVRTVHLKVISESCPQCGKVFHRRHTLKRHVEVVHQKLPSKPKVPKLDCTPKPVTNFGTPKKTWNSNLPTLNYRGPPPCAYRYSHDGKRQITINYDEHFVVDVDGQSFICNYCGVINGTRKGIRHHIRVVHLKLVVVNCPDCGKEFNRRHSLKRHIQAVHGKSDAPTSELSEGDGQQSRPIPNVLITANAAGMFSLLDNNSPGTSDRSGPQPSCSMDWDAILRASGVDHLVASRVNQQNAVAESSHPDFISDSITSSNVSFSSNSFEKMTSANANEVNDLLLVAPISANDFASCANSSLTPEKALKQPQNVDISCISSTGIGSINEQQDAMPHSLSDPAQSVMIDSNLIANNQEPCKAFVNSDSEAATCLMGSNVSPLPVEQTGDSELPPIDPYSSSGTSNHLIDPVTNKQAPVYGAVNHLLEKEGMIFPDTTLERYRCKLCKYSNAKRSYAFAHFRRKHLHLDWIKCPVCGEMQKNKSLFNSHVAKLHSEFKPTTTGSGSGSRKSVVVADLAEAE